MQRVKLTPDLQKTICGAIVKGAFPHVAAEAVGVPKEVFEKWMEMGTRERRPRLEYVRFYRAVQQARAQARLAAEWAAHDNDPRLWLRSGPGKETLDNPGWTTIVRPQIQDIKTINLFTSPDFLHFMATLRTALAPFPEALKALTQALDRPEPAALKPGPE